MPDDKKQHVNRLTEKISEKERRCHYTSLKSLLKASKPKGYKVKNVKDNNNDDMMGNLLGCQFDSDQKGGYVYFWSNGWVGYQLLDYKTGEEIIKDTTEKLDNPQVLELLSKLEAKL